MLLDKALLNDIRDGLRGDEPPPVLWHYTSAAAARDILQSRSVRLGCHAFMNDPGEGTVAETIVSDAWGAAIDACPSHPRLDLSCMRDTADVRSYFNFERPELPPTFLFSLTELRDSLSQWSRYGDNGAGVALGFAIEVDDLPAASGSPWSTDTSLIRVDYDGTDGHPPSRLRPLVARLLAEYLPRFEGPTQVKNTLIALIHRLNPVVKRAAYFEEREWRVITRTVLESDALYDVTCNRFGFSPYVPLAMDHGLKLVEMMLGPKLPVENLWSAKWMCKKFDFNPVISRSALAYR